MNCSLKDGRDEMNLADFPISALQRAQRANGEGGKLDHIEFSSSRFDPQKRQRVQQKVTLTSTADDGLPTPADEHVILALLHVAKHTTNFSDATVHFAPAQLFTIMGWAPNGRSYDRLKDVLRRLKALTIRYENAWWDASGRAYEEEFATGILSAYRIARQTSGPRTSGQPLQSYVTWTQQFHSSLMAGNIKRLNLELFFRLRTPTAQRIYRFLDKRFYNSTELSLDLLDFACGHVGMTEVDNVAVIKRRLMPALQELEEVGFLKPLPQAERFTKVKAGQWRIHLASPASANQAPEAGPVAVIEKAPASDGVGELVEEFYRQWDPAQTIQPGPRDRQPVELLLEEIGREEAREVLKHLVTTTRKQWPQCRSLSGAARKYLGEARRHHEQEKSRRHQRVQAEEIRQQQQIERERDLARDQDVASRWDHLSPEEQQEIRDLILTRLQGRFAPEAFIRRLCLEHLRERFSEG